MLERIPPTNLFKALPLSSVIVSPDAPNFTIADVNNAYAKATGTDESELIGKSIFEIFPYHPDNIGADAITHLQQSLLTVLSTGKSHKMTAQKYRVPVSGTQKFEVRYWEPENIPVLDDNNKVTCIVHSIQDVTERQMSLLINNTEESFILLDEKLHIISLNKKSRDLFKEILGVEVYKGDYIVDYARPERKAIVKELYNRILEGATEKSEISLPAIDGESKHFAVRYAPAKDNDNQTIGVFITARDITEHKELQNRQQELLTELTQRNTFIETVFQNIPIGIAVNKITEGSAILINRYFIETYGWSEEELSDISSFFEKVYPDAKYRKEIKDRIMADMKSGDPERMSWKGITITTGSGEKKIINSKNIPFFDQNLMISTTIDVTESARQTAEITRIKTNQESLINGTEDLIWSLDTNLCLITANNAYLQTIRGITHKIPAEGDSVFIESFGKDLNKRWENYYKRALKGEKFSIKEQIYDPLKQSMIYGLISLNPMYTASGELFGIACYSKDITEDNLHLQALENTKDELNKIMNSSLDIICTIDEAGYFIKVNAAAKDIWGYMPEELIGKPFMQFVYAEDQEKTAKASAEIMRGKDLTNFENRYIKKDGLLISMVWSATWDSKEKINYCVARDATEKLRNESALIESEKKYKYLFDNNPMPMVIWDFETKKIVDCNEEAQFKYGYTRNEFLQLTIKEVRLEEDIPLLEEATKTESIYGAIHKSVWRHKKKNGELMFMEVDGHLIDFNGRRASLVMLNDVTEKLKAEEQKEFEKRDKEALINNTDDLLWSLNNDYKLIAANNAFIKNVEISTGFIMQNGDTVLQQDIFSDELLTFWRQLYDKAFAGESFMQEVYNPAFRNTEESWSEIRFNPIYQSENIIGVACYSRNITEAKWVEKKIKDSEAKYRSLVESSMDAILLTIKDGGILAANTTACKIFQMTEEELCKARREDLVEMSDPRLPLLVEERNQTGKAKGELTFIRKDGSRFPGAIASVVFPDVNGQVRTSMVISDITEIKNAEKEIIESNQRYQYVTQATSDAIWDWNLLTDKIYWGEGFQILFGYGSQDLTSDINSWIKYIHPEDYERVVKGIYELIDSLETNWIDEYRFKKKDQTYAYVIDKGFVIRDEQGRALRMVGAMQDITRQKQEEQHLKLLESVITNANDAIVITDASPVDGEGPVILYVNDSFTKMTGYSREEVLGKPPRIFEGPKTDKKKLAVLREALQKCKPCTIEIINYRKNGEAYWINRSVVPVANEKGLFTHWISMERDVTERKLAEGTLKEKNLELKQLSSYLQNVREEERKYIAREVHDELGQLASAIKIDMDWFGIKIGKLDENAKTRILHANNTLEVLISSIRKIASSLRPSILDDFGLNAALQWHCAEFQNLNGIQCLFEPGFDDKGLSMDLKTELYRIAQESLTNVMRHAQASNVRVATKEDADNLYLTITDNGKGFDISQRKNTLGLIGLRERAISLKGEMHIETGVGVGTTISAVIPKSSE